MKLKLPVGTFRAYLFDCDGTIADSMPLHYIAWKTVLAEWNCEYAEDLFYSWGGKPVRNIIADLNEIHGLDMPIDAVATKKEALYLEQLPQLKAIPEVLEHIQAEHGRIPFAVVSGSRRSRRFTHRDRLAGQIRYHRRRGRLHARQARPGCISVGCCKARRGARRLPCL